MNSCLSCGENTKNKKYCSLSCANREQRLNAPRKDRTKYCENCGETFQAKDLSQKYCSHSCSAKVNNLGVRRHGQPPATECLECGGRLTHGKVYCSHRCHIQRDRNILLARFLAGENVSTKNREELPEFIRGYLIEQAANQCSLCGWNGINPTTGRCPVQVDHIDGNAANNTKSNLTILCPNCHSLTPTFGGLNLGKGRDWRRNARRASAR